MKYYCSDLHLFHDYRLQCRSQYGSMEEMNKAILAPIYALPKYSDCYVIGDAASDNVGRVIEALAKAECRLHLVYGNHDPFSLRESRVWTTSQQYLEHKDVDEYGKEHHLVMFHFPIRVWSKMNRGAIHLYGHMHSNDLTRNSADVGIDSIHWGGKPVSFATIYNKMQSV